MQHGTVAMNETWPDSGTFWRNKRVIVTGGAGFLGSFVVEKLQARGVARVFAPRSKDYDLTNLDAIRCLLLDTSVEVSVNGSRPVSQPNGRKTWFPVDRQPADMVIHLAARVGGIGANRAHPAEFFYDNLMMGVQLLHECWAAGVGKFVATSTICAYPKHTPVPFREEDLWNGYPEETNAPYGLAKKMLLVQSQAYRQQYGFNSIILFPVNLYGPRDNFDPESSHVIPALIRKCVEARIRGDREIVAWGDGSPTREFLYVEDAAEGILLAAERYDQSEPVNLGSRTEISIRELTETVASACNFRGGIDWDPSQPNGQPRRKLSVDKALQSFGFEATTPFSVGLANAVAWFEQRSPISRKTD